MLIKCSYWLIFSAMEVNERCAICKQSVDGGGSSVSTIRERGGSAINRASDTRKDSIHTVPGQMIHLECRRKYCNPAQIAKVVRQEQPGPSTSSDRHILNRSSEEGFSFKTDCIFCGRPIKLVRKKKKQEVLQVKTIEFKDTIMVTCRERADDWSYTVKVRILHVQDLHAADAVYHQTCSVNFRTKKQMPTAQLANIEDAKRSKIGRPKSDERTVAFMDVVRYLEENDDEQITINDLIDIMKQSLAGTEQEPYSYTHMKTRLGEHFGERIMLTVINGKPNVVTFRTTARAVLQEYYKQRQEINTGEEKVKLVRAAAKLIKEDIKAIETSHEVYPSCDDLESQEAGVKYLPDTLLALLEAMFAGKNSCVKVASIGQAMMQATRPGVLLAPLQLGLGVQLHHHFASRFLIDSLHHHGFCCSYQEVHQFERNAAQSHGTDIPNLTTEFVQYAADNVDHNIRTLDGHRTFHGMGMIAAVTPGTRSNRPIPRVRVTSLDVAIVGRVQIRYHREERRGMAAVTYQKFVNFKAQNNSDNLDVLWKTSILFGSPRPAWSGMM